MGSSSEDGGHKCPFEGCEFTSASILCIGSHKQSHNIEERKQLYLDELKRLADELGRTPGQADMDEFGEYSQNPYYTCFGTWNNALQEAGFEPNHVKGIDEDDLKAALRQLADELGRTPTHIEMDNHGAYSVTAYKTCFGSWNNAVTAIGLEPNKRRDIPRGELLAELYRLEDELGHVPRRDDLTEHSKFCEDPYRRCFGSWAGALEAAEMERPPAIEVYKDDLLSDLQAVADTVGRTPTVPDIDEHAEYAISTYQRRFGSWNDALKDAGFELNHVNGISEGLLLSELHRLADELGRAPRACEMSRKGKYSEYPFRRQFGSWDDAVIAAGYEPCGLPTGPEHHLWKGNFDTYYGPNWDEQREKRLKHDNFRCIVCGMTRKTHDDEYGCDFHVHHVQRKGNFVRPDGTFDYDRANRVENLRTLCCEHHTKWEGIPVAPQ